MPCFGRLLHRGPPLEEHELELLLLLGLVLQLPLQLLRIVLLLLLLATDVLPPLVLLRLQILQVFTPGPAIVRVV